MAKDLLLLINKPKGISSTKAVELVKKSLGVDKAGHTGTLDPLATGLLLVLTGKKTKEASKFLKLNKTYLVKGRLGLRTNTFDIEGKVLERNNTPVKKEDLQKILKEFQGEIWQTPPVFSAKKVGGKEAYKLARKGIKVNLSPQKVKIYSLKLKSFNYPYFEILCTVSSGFYVRSLINDIGQKLGVGAIMVELCRTQVGPYKLSQAHNLYDVLIKAQSEKRKKRKV